MIYLDYFSFSVRCSKYEHEYVGLYENIVLVLFDILLEL